MELTSTRPAELSGQMIFAERPQRPSEQGQPWAVALRQKYPHSADIMRAWSADSAEYVADNLAVVAERVLRSGQTLLSINRLALEYGKTTAETIVAVHITSVLQDLGAAANTTDGAVMKTASAIVGSDTLRQLALVSLLRFCRRAKNGEYDELGYGKISPFKILQALNHNFAALDTELRSAERVAQGNIRRENVGRYDTEAITLRQYCVKHGYDYATVKAYHSAIADPSSLHMGQEEEIDVILADIEGRIVRRAAEEWQCDTDAAFERLKSDNPALGLKLFEWGRMHLPQGGGAR